MLQFLWMEMLFEAIKQSANSTYFERKCENFTFQPQSVFTFWKH